MEMAAIFVRAHAIAVIAPVSATHIHVALTTPTTVKPSVRMPDMVWSTRDYTHSTVTETNKHYQKRY